MKTRNPIQPATHRGAGFLSFSYRRSWCGPNYRGGHPLPHQSQILGRDLCAEEISRHPGRMLHITVLGVKEAEDFCSRTCGMGYRVFIRDSHGFAGWAFWTPHLARVWAHAYGMPWAEDIPDTAEGVAVLVREIPLAPEMRPITYRPQWGTENRSARRIAP